MEVLVFSFFTNWKYSTYTPLCNNHSLESHAITVTAPVKLHVLVIYRPPGQLGTFLEELDGLLSSFPEDGSPLVVFGDFNIHLDKPYAANFHSLASFDLKRLTTTSAHKSGSQLDLIYTRNCIANKVLVKPLHTSDHYFITFNLHLATSEPQTPLPVTFRWNLRSLSPSHLTLVVSSAERKWRKSKDPSDPSTYQSLLSSFSAEVHTRSIRTKLGQSVASSQLHTRRNSNHLLIYW